jgi:hypothetical protein
VLTGKTENLKVRGADLISVTQAARRFIVMSLCMFFESTECPAVRTSPFLWNSDNLHFKHLHYQH